MSRWFVLLLMQALGVDRVGHAAAFVDAVAWVADHDAPPPGFTREEGAALLIVSLAEEGGFCLYGCARGDLSRHPFGSVCSGQVRASSEAQAKLLESSPMACARGAYYVIVEGARLCPSAPLAPYCGGCSSPRARAISDRRMARARSALGQPSE